MKELTLIRKASLKPQNSSPKPLDRPFPRHLPLQPGRTHAPHWRTMRSAGGAVPFQCCGRTQPGQPSAKCAQALASAHFPGGCGSACAHFADGCERAAVAVVVAGRARFRALSFRAATSRGEPRVSDATDGMFALSLFGSRCCRGAFPSSCPYGRVGDTELEKLYIYI